MKETDYNQKVKAAAQAYLRHVISYNEWYDYMKKLIEEKK